MNLDLNQDLVLTVSIGISLWAVVSHVACRWRSWPQLVGVGAVAFVATFIGMTVIVLATSSLGLLALVPSFLAFQLLLRLGHRIWTCCGSCVATVDTVMDLSDPDGLSEANVIAKCTTVDGCHCLVKPISRLGVNSRILVAYTESLVTGARWNFQQVAR